MAESKIATSRKSRLGRGLAGLVVDSTQEAAPGDSYVPVADDPAANQAIKAEPPSQAGYRDIPADQIAANPYQPRREFRAEELAELSDSIARQGMLQPLTVCRAGDDSEQPYIVIAGERRLRAARQAGLSAVPCVVRDASPRDMLELALIENIQRVDLNPIERACGYREYIDRFKLTGAEVAERMGQARSTVANHLRLLDLSEPIQRAVADGSVSFGHAKVLAGVTGDSQRQAVLAERIVAEGLSVRQLEALVAGPAGADTSAARTRSGRARPAYVVDLEERLGQRVGTRVRIMPGRAKHSGRIVMEYYSLDDFDRIAELLGIEAGPGEVGR